jgi:hypothetical protein
MSVLDPKKTLSNLLKKGFTSSNHDHKYLDLFFNGKFVTHTKVSHGSKNEIDEYLIKQMSAQCKLSKKEFIDLAKCPLSKEAYFKILKKDGWLE